MTTPTTKDNGQSLIRKGLAQVSYKTKIQVADTYDNEEAFLIHLLRQRIALSR